MGGNSLVLGRGQNVTAQITRREDRRRLRRVKGSPGFPVQEFLVMAVCTHGRERKHSSLFPCLTMPPNVAAVWTSLLHSFCLGWISAFPAENVCRKGCQVRSIVRGKFKVLRDNPNLLHC